MASRAGFGQLALVWRSCSKPQAGLPDETFNKKSNNARKRTEKAKPIVSRPEKSQTLFVVLLFFCLKKHLSYNNIIRSFLRNWD